MATTSGYRLYVPSRATMAVIESLELGPAPDLGHLIGAVEKKYGKKLLFEEVADDDVLGAGVTGTWTSTPTHGVIRYRAGIKSWVRHIVLHELSHILLGHRAKPGFGVESAGLISHVGGRRGVGWMLCRQIDIPLTESELAAENLAFGLAQVLRGPSAPSTNEAEKVFGL